MDALDAFNSAFAARDRDEILEVFALHPHVGLVTSEEFVVRGPEELEAFADRYVSGATTYSWEWDSREEVDLAGDVRLVVAEGTETAVTGGESVRERYRMTLVLILREGRWRILHAHGSTPHVPTGR